MYTLPYWHRANVHTAEHTLSAGYGDQDCICDELLLWGNDLNIKVEWSKTIAKLFKTIC
jgi:hypothetical protein